MTDEELGRRVIRLINNAPRGKKLEIYLGAEVNKLLAARPEVTREAVEDFAKKQVRPFGDVDANWKAASEIAHRAISHFAPAREARPIDEMSVEDLKRAFAEQYSGGSVSVSVEFCARVAHRLAQPVPVVDADAEAKRLAWLQYNTATPPGHPHRYFVDVEELWHNHTEQWRNGWRAVAAAAQKEGGA